MSRPLSSESVYRAVAHPLRRRVLEMLLKGEQQATHLETGLGTSRSNMSQHMRVLRHAGLILFQRQGTKLIYRLNPTALRPALNWFMKLEREAKRE